MSTYLVQSHYFRQLHVDHVQAVIKEGRGLLLIGTDGSRTFVDQPNKYGVTRWMLAAQQGRVFVPWASRWSSEEELPELAEPVETPTDRQSVTPAAQEVATTPD